VNIIKLCYNTNQGILLADSGTAEVVLRTSLRSALALHWYGKGMQSNENHRKFTALPGKDEASMRGEGACRDVPTPAPNDLLTLLQDCRTNVTLAARWMPGSNGVAKLRT